jgi:copper chaperone CopZ|tara:strand:- start:126 stop:434 length:309 start_codon:yes stop_codon:yes gene_type:complete
MKLFTLIVFTFLILIKYDKLASQDKINSEVLNISVNGLVCDFCARSIEKIFSKKESVQSININLEKMLITINLKKGKNLDDNTIKQLIKDSGYDVREINRDN